MKIFSFLLDFLVSGRISKSGTFITEVGNAVLATATLPCAPRRLQGFGVMCCHTNSRDRFAASIHGNLHGKQRRSFVDFDPVKLGFGLRVIT